MSNERKMVTLDDIERRHLADHRKPYYDWLRHLVTLCIGTLTALVALQGHYVPLHPKLLWALAVCWASLTASIFLGILALRAEYLLPLEAVKKIGSSGKCVGKVNTWHFCNALKMNCINKFSHMKSLNK